MTLKEAEILALTTLRQARQDMSLKRQIKNQRIPVGLVEPCRKERRDINWKVIKKQTISGLEV